MTNVLITGTNESTGKTAIALALAQLAREQGCSVGYMKPKGTRLRSVVGKTLDEDPKLARELLDLDAEMHELEPIVYSPTFIQSAIRSQENPDELRETVYEHFESLATDRDFMTIEGGGTLSTGGVVDLTDPDVADLLDAQILLVADYRQPGDIDEVLWAADCMGERLAGVLFNSVADGVYDQLERDAVPFLEGRGISVLGVLPRTRELAGVSIADFASELGAEIATDAPTDAYIERLSVGAMGADAALRHFRRTKDAVLITGGDRSDIHSVALEAPGIKCLCLTGGFRPSSAVLGKAEERGVPVLLTQSDTLTTIERAEEVVHAGRTRDEVTVGRMHELLINHADLQELLDCE